MEKNTQRFDTITVTLDNGEKLAAPTGVWLAAFLGELKVSADPTLRELSERILNRVDNMIGKVKAQRIHRPAEGHHVMQAEGLSIAAPFGPASGKKGPLH